MFVSHLRVFGCFSTHEISLTKINHGFTVVKVQLPCFLGIMSLYNHGFTANTMVKLWLVLQNHGSFVVTMV